MSCVTASNQLHPLEFPATGPNADRGLRFVISAKADPGTVARVVEPFAKRGLVPDGLTSRLCGDRMCIEVEMADMDADLGAYIARCIGEIFVLRSVDLQTGSA